MINWSIRTTLFYFFAIGGLQDDSKILFPQNMPKESFVDIMCATIHNTVTRVALLNQINTQGLNYLLIQHTFSFLQPSSLLLLLRLLQNLFPMMHR